MESMSEQIHRDLGAMGARLNALEAQTARIEGKLDVTLDYIAQQKGGKKLLAVLGTVCGAAGAGLAWVIGFAFQAIQRHA
jgi:hypothetical protein